jgi:hypothetical protein
MKTKYRLYADDTVVHQDDFEEYDNAHSYYDDYTEVEVPDWVIDYIYQCVSE